LVFVCGNNSEGQLGVGDTENRVVPTLVRGELEGRKVLQVAVGGRHTMCVTEDGLVFAFGFNGAGRLGVGDHEIRLVPTLLRGELENKSVAQAAAGYRHTMLVTADGLVFACGSNVEGQLGVGDTEDRLVPTLVTGQLQGKTAVYVAAGGYHTLCITADGSLFSWGWNGSGQLGVGDKGDRHTICTTADGSVSTWGYGYGGRLGLGDDRSDKLVPTLVRGELL
jgi:alpha-tubulin suppressor-like RCC1 family protein